MKKGMSNIWTSEYLKDTLKKNSAIVIVKDPKIENNTSIFDESNYNPAILGKMGQGISFNVGEKQL